MKRAVERVGFRLLVGLIRPLPRGASVRIATVLGRFVFDVLRVRRRVAVGNVMARLAPAGGTPEGERIARASYEVMARTFLDLLRIDRIRDEELWRLLSPEEFDVFRRFPGREHGGVLVSGHFGNWELLVLGIRRMGVRVHAMAADQANDLVNAYVKGTRARAGIRTFSARREVRAALQALRDSDYLATLLDQDARRKGLFVDFLGAPASSHKGVVGMAVRTGCPLIPGVLVDEGGAYRLVIGETWRADPARPEDDNLLDGIRHFHRFLEKQVRARPGNYLWAHRRWKTRPPPERET